MASYDSKQCENRPRDGQSGSEYSGILKSRGYVHMLKLPEGSKAEGDVSYPILPCFPSLILGRFEPI